MKQFTFNEKDLEIFTAKVRETEREECAALVERLNLAHPESGKLTAEQIARAIRLRNVNPQSYTILTHPEPYKKGFWDQQDML